MLVYPLYVMRWPGGIPVSLTRGRKSGHREPGLLSVLHLCYQDPQSVQKTVQISLRVVTNEQ